MYADVDVEALIPVAPLFAAHATPLAAHQSTFSSKPSYLKIKRQRAFLGRFDHYPVTEVVPNSWMASPPGHPFWLLQILDTLGYAERSSPDLADVPVEHVTGPEALGRMIKRYLEDFKNAPLRQYICERIETKEPTWDLFCRREEVTSGNTYDEDIRDVLIVLPQNQIYPYSWIDHPLDSVCLASGQNPRFNPEECKKQIDVEASPSYFITYCSHAW